MQVATLLETDQVVDADTGQGRDLFASQPRCTSTAHVAQSDIGRMQRLATCTQEGRKLGTIGSRSQCASVRAIQGGPATTRIEPVFLPAVATPMMEP